MFAIYSKLRADLLKCMLIKATEFEDFEIPALRERFGIMTLFPLPETQGLTVRDKILDEEYLRK